MNRQGLTIDCLGGSPIEGTELGLAVYGLVACLMVFALYGWFGQREAWGGRFLTASTPAKASQLEGFNGADPRLLGLAEGMG